MGANNSLPGLHSADNVCHDAPGATVRSANLLAGSGIHRLSGGWRSQDASVVVGGPRGPSAATLNVVNADTRPVEPGTA
jgi:hypothetical protein